MIGQDILWCVAVIRNASIRSHHKKHRWGNEILLEDIPEVSSRSSGASEFDNIELIEMLRTLPRVEMQVLYKIYIRDLTEHEIAYQLHLKQQQVSRIKRRALELLRKEVV